MQLDIRRPPSMLRWFGLRLGGPLAVVLVLALVGGVASHNPAMISGGLIAAVVFGLIIGIELPLILRSQARRRQRLMAASAPGTLYAATVTPLGSLGAPPSGSLRTQMRNRGILALTDSGLDYKPANPAESSLGPEFLAWSRINSVTLAPRTPLAGRLEVTTYGGATHRWQVPGIPELVTALERVARTSGAT